MDNRLLDLFFHKIHKGIINNNNKKEENIISIQVLIQKTIKTKFQNSF